VELGEDACRLTRVPVQDLSLMQLGVDDPAQPLVPRQSEDIIDLVRLAPAHQFLAAEAGVGAQPDLYTGPALAHLSNDALHSSAEPAAASWLAGRRCAHSNWSPAKIYNGK
jgi:hypothetical protein